MSTAALKHIARTNGPTPAARLILYELANAHNAETGQCNPSAHYLSAKTGMNVNQVRRQIRILLSGGHIQVADLGFSFPGISPEDAQPIPANWRPSDETVAALIAAFPNHHFSPDEALHDFLAFAQRRSLRFASGALDGAFFSNISALLARRKPGAVDFAGAAGRAPDTSVRSLLAGTRDRAGHELR